MVVWCGATAAQTPSIPPPASSGAERVVESFGSARRGPISEDEGRWEPSSPLGGALLGGLERGLSDLVASLRRDIAAARANLRRLRGLGSIDPADLGSVARTLAPPIAVSLAVAVLGRLALLSLLRGIGRRAPGRGPLGVALLSSAKVVLDLIVIIAAVIAAAATSAAVAPKDVSAPESRILIGYLLAFLAAGALIVVLRAVFSPAVPELRPFPMSDATARYWTRRLAAVAIIMALGELLLPAILIEIATPIVAHATTVAFHATALLYLMLLVILRRRSPREYFERMAAEREEIWPILLSLAARCWHWLALAYLAFLLHQVMTSGAAGLILLEYMVEAAAALALALLVSRMLDQVAAHGARLPEPVKRAMPGVEARLDDFLRSFAGVLRYVVFALWIGFVLQALGIFGLAEWLQRRFGFDILGATLGLLAISLACFGIWLAISAWIDHRLTPHGGRVPTAREQTVFSLLRNAVAVVIVLIGLYYALLGVGISLAPLLASAGVIALAISWGSQKLVQDIITGLFIQLENAINVGDVVEAGGKVGVVEKLTIRSVSLRDVEGVYHLIPFSSVDAVSNHTRDFSYHVADISIAYGADIDQAKAAMLAAFEQLVADPDWRWRLLGGIEWFGVQALAENAVILRARLKTRPGDQWAVGRAYAETVKKRLDAEGIEIPFPQRKIWLASDEGPDRLHAKSRPTRQTQHGDTPTDADIDDG
ncbi:mechanosensitive ion channel domain-containing protein [Amaricoccus solimangrovi]|uniref:mechanosensitive ion channel domain-containing protein n=1 Tax=Amaricoccus solimangrovi TaxID=2589815 RepID=UPI001F2129C9|nr:mechanosensitive ion channel domain-containing protein [Amaricoccus solimangrovi]